MQAKIIAALPNPPNCTISVPANRGPRNAMKRGALKTNAMPVPRDRVGNSSGSHTGIQENCPNVKNALIAAARFGNAIENAVVYSTMRPCFDCTKAMLQAKVKAIYYLHNWGRKEKPLQLQYEQLQKRLGVHQIKMADPKSDWANNIKSGGR